MKPMKKLALYLLIPALLTACGTEENLYETPEELGVLYQNGETGERVAEVKRLTDEERASIPMFVSNSYDSFQEKFLYEDTAFVALGKISNIRELRIDYTTQNGTPDFTYETLFDLTVERIHHIDIGGQKPQSGDTVSILSPHSSYDLSGDLKPIPAEGDEYLIFVTLTSIFKGRGLPLDMTEFSEYTVLTPIYNLIRKNGDYLEITDWFDDELAEYDSERISKADAFGVTNDNYIAAGYHWGVEWVRVHNVNGYEGVGGIFEPREAVLNSPVYAELYLEYMEQHPETDLDLGMGDNPIDHDSLLRRIGNLPKDVEQILFEKTLKAYNYNFPDKLKGEYDYKLGLKLEHKETDEVGYTAPFSGLTANIYLYHFNAFENTIEKRSLEYRFKNGGTENEEN